MIEKKYGQEMRRLYVTLENNEIDETKFYNELKKQTMNTIVSMKN